MFSRDYEFWGKHAQYTKYLCNDLHIFERYIDVYMSGALMGLIYGRTAKRDISNKDRAAILTDTFVKEKLNCQFTYRLVMLLDESMGLTKSQRIDRAFRDDTNEEAMKNNMNLFNSYVLGGVEVLFEKITSNCTTEEEHIDRVNEVVNYFKNYNEKGFEEKQKTFIDKLMSS